MLFCSCVFSPLSIAITLLGEEKANLGAFCTFVRFVLVWFCWFFSFCWCLERAAVCNCGTPWTFLLSFVFFYSFSLTQHGMNAILYNSPKPFEKIVIITSVDGPM